jgi:uncharacterized protein YndB with AHSA1/START domain
MTDPAVASTAHRSVAQVEINAPIQRVWDALTKEGEPLPFFFGSVMHTPRLQPGSPIRMRTPDAKYTGVVGDILEVEPPRRFAHTFRFTHLDEPPCKVIYELEELAPDRTRFTLITEDITPGTKTAKSMKQGEAFITKSLKGLLENGRPPFGPRLILGMIALMRFATPARCRSEHWTFDAPTDSAPQS